VQVAAPCMFSVTNWVRRHLSGTEMCLVRDVSVEIQEALKSKNIAALCKDKNLVPLKVCTWLLSLIVLKGETPNQEHTTKQAKSESEGGR
jgi:hypothetical protein